MTGNPCPAVPEAGNIANLANVSEHDRDAVVIEDDPDVRALLVELLQQSGFAVTDCSAGAEGLRAVREKDPDLVTLDLNLPDLDGIEVCRRLRETSEAYVIMLTARPDEIDRLVGLETGADDYSDQAVQPAGAARAGRGDDAPTPAARDAPRPRPSRRRPTTPR